ncbi:Hypothetical_protein [Hexamita inflata]|uniref:Hypothetical_protein n=1 Tax=Hexamita inflata TaxID=28002 RepID=A0AA86NQZ6_9EUKA|nr:Hypothetical protein HINF_LOCUS11438 [Hexamita inflata]
MLESEHCQELLHFSHIGHTSGRRNQACGARQVHLPAQLHHAITDVGLKRERVVSSSMQRSSSGDVLARGSRAPLQLARYETGATSGICYGLSLQNQLSGIVWFCTSFSNPAFLSSLQIVMGMSQQQKPQKPRVFQIAAHHSPLQLLRLFADQWNRALKYHQRELRVATIISSNGGHEPYSNNALQPSCDSMSPLTLRSCSKRLQISGNQLCKISRSYHKRICFKSARYNNNTNRPQSGAGEASETVQIPLYFDEFYSDTKKKYSFDCGLFQYRKLISRKYQYHTYGIYQCILLLTK